MDTDTLIRALGSQLEPAPRTPTAGRLATAIVLGLLGGGILLAATLGARPDLAEAVLAVALKALFGVAVAAVGLAVLTRVARPAGGGGTGRIMAVVALACLGLASVLLLIEQPGHRLAALTGGGFPWCVVLIPAYGVPAAIGVTWALRDAAPTRLRLAGAVMGVCAGAVGAMVYALFCPVDSAAFVLTWYLAGIAAAAGIGASIGPTVLRW